MANATLMNYLTSLCDIKNISEVKTKIITRLWHDDTSLFPKPWVSSDELLSITGQKYFDRRTRELRDQMGCDLETSYREEFSGHAWRINSPKLSPPQNREYLTQTQKNILFEKHNFSCAACGSQVLPGVRGLQADHKVPLSRRGSNDLHNWQAICNNCNVGKRRACAGCQLNCMECSWAFPETVGISSFFRLNDTTIKDIKDISRKLGVTDGEVVAEAVSILRKLR